MPFLSFHLLFLRGLFKQWSIPYTYIYIHIYIHIYIYHEKSCLYEFTNLAVILKHNCRFINFILFLMVDPLPPFMPALITWVFKRESLCNPNTNSFFLPKTLSPFPLSSPLPLPQTFPSVFFDPNSCTMTPVKSQSSSHRNGKKAISDPPTTRDVGKEVVYSESDQSNEEEAQYTLDSECAPLIDPWYDIHPHFPKIPSDYALSPRGHVWLALC